MSGENWITPAIDELLRASNATAFVRNLVAETDISLNLLRDIEWRAQFNDDHVCLICFNTQQQGHKEDCRMARVLRCEGVEQ